MVNGIIKDDINPSKVLFGLIFSAKGVDPYNLPIVYAEVSTKETKTKRKIK